jgi:hypothetical protein
LLILGLVLVAVGLVLAGNLVGAADVWAAMAKPFPAWMRAPYSDNPMYYRIFGVVFVVGGFVCAVSGVRG